MENTILTQDPERLQKLTYLAEAITQQLKSKQKSEVVVICTHNSRRSHIGQVMLRKAAVEFGLNGIVTYSGGTEATAMNERVAKAFEEHGFDVYKKDNGDNPLYTLAWGESDDDRLEGIHSKVYDDIENPQSDFIALIVCSSADSNCPFVKGAAHRIYLPYEDPKNHDDTDQEATAYLNKIIEIGAEMRYVVEKVNEKI